MTAKEPDTLFFLPICFINVCRDVKITIVGNNVYNIIYRLRKHYLEMFFKTVKLEMPLISKYRKHILSWIFIDGTDVVGICRWLEYDKAPNVYIFC